MVDAFDVPDGWTIKPIGEAARLVKEKVKPTTVPDARYVGLEHVEAHTMRLLGNGRGSDVKSEKTRFEAGDVLYGKLRPYLNKVARPPFDGISSTDFLVFTESEELDAGYLAQFLNQLSVANYAHRFSTGVQLPRVSWKSLATLPIAFPSSKPEQRAIVAQIERARGLSSSASRHLAQAGRAIERFRRAVLAAACSGRLTADWRDGRDFSPAVDGLAERRTESKSPRAPVSPPRDEEFDELPARWAWASVGEIGDVQLGGTPSRNDAEYWGGGIPWVSSGEVANCRIRSTRETITEAGLASSSAKLYPVGTVLIAMIGEGKTRGQAAILDIEASTNQNAAGILPNAEIVSAEYVWRWALGQYEVTRAVGRGGNQPALNKQKVRELAIPVPPLEEQRMIVERVDQLLALADGLQERIQLASTRIDRSSQAVLAKAFRGELVVSS